MQGKEGCAQYKDTLLLVVALSLRRAPKNPQRWGMTLQYCLGPSTSMGLRLSVSPREAK